MKSEESSNGDVCEEIGNEREFRLTAEDVEDLTYLKERRRMSEELAVRDEEIRRLKMKLGYAGKERRRLDDNDLSEILRISKRLKRIASAENKIGKLMRNNFLKTSVEILSYRCKK